MINLTNQLWRTMPLRHIPVGTHRKVGHLKKPFLTSVKCLADQVLPTRSSCGLNLPTGKQGVPCTSCFLVIACFNLPMVATRAEVICQLYLSLNDSHSWKAPLLRCFYHVVSSATSDCTICNHQQLDLSSSTVYLDFPSHYLHLCLGRITFGSKKEAFF